MRANGSRGRCVNGGDAGLGVTHPPVPLVRVWWVLCQNPDAMGQTHPWGAVGQVWGQCWSLCSPSAGIGGETPNVCRAGGGMEEPGFSPPGQAWLMDSAALSRLKPQFGGVQVGPCIPVPTAAPVGTHQASRDVWRRPPSPGHEVPLPACAVAITDSIPAGWRCLSYPWPCCGTQTRREPHRAAGTPSTPKAPFPVPSSRFQALTLSINKGEGEGGWLAC